MTTISTPKRFGVLGSGDVGQALSKGLVTQGYDVRIGSRSPDKLVGFSKSTKIKAGSFRDVAKWGEALILAVAGTGALEALELIGSEHLRGKLVIDATNPIAADPPEDGVLRFFTGPNESLMERMQAAYPDARFVKAFNSVGSDLMVHPLLSGGPPTMFYCGNDEPAKAVVNKLLEQLGWDGA